MTNPPFIDTNIRFAAMREIHAAIDHFRRGDFECAVTLAAAGQAMVPETDESHSRQKAGILEALIASLKNEPVDIPEIIHWLKHGTLRIGGSITENVRISEFAVIATIWRGIAKFEAYYVENEGDCTPQMLSFERWAAAYLEERWSGARVVARLTS